MLIGQRSSYIVLAIVYEWQTKDKRPQRSNVNVRNLWQNSQYLWNIVFSRRSIWVLLELVGRWTQQFNKIDHNTRKIGQTYIWNPMTTDLLCKHWFASSVWNFCCWVADVPPRETSQRQRARRNGCFRRLCDPRNKHFFDKSSVIKTTGKWSYCWANFWSSVTPKLTTMSWSSQFDFLTCYVIGYPISQRTLQCGVVNNVKLTVTEWSRQY